MASINKVILIGNLGRDPEVRYTPNGNAICNISVATTRNWKDKTSGDKVEETEWHRVVFNDKLAEIVGQYVRKGKPIFIEGRIVYRKYTDKDGNERSVTEVVLQRFRGELTLLDSKPQGDAQEPTQKAQNSDGFNKYQAAKEGRLPPPKTDIDDDIPF